jgi:Ca-activated chloride channel homolog
MEKKKGKQPIIASFMALAVLCACALSLSCPRGDARASGKRLSLISGSENADLIPLIEEFGKESGIKVDVTLRGTLDIMVELNRSPSSYDAVWASNSIWLSMLENKSLVKNAKSTSISPVVFGIRASKAKELGLDGPAIRTADILAAVAKKKLSFLMGSATQTNSGASAYLGLLSVLAGSPEVLTKADIDAPALKSKLREFFAGIERASGSAEFLDELFLSGSYDALVSYESSLLRLNRQLEAAGKETLRLVYPVDGVSLSDSPLGYVDNGNPAKEAAFKAFQAWALSAATQRKLTATGRRAWYGGDVDNPAPELFKAEWGVDTKRYIVPSKYPQADVIRAALTLYQSELKKPSYTAFCLDFSGSMYGDGRDQLMAALDYVLDPEKSGKDFIQFSERDSLVLYPFSTDVGDPIESGGADARAAYESVSSIVPDGSTNLYGAAETALRRLAGVDGTEYVRSIVIMTDGKANVGAYAALEKAYAEIAMDIPIFCITFGGADLKELKKIAKLSNARVFDGRTDLVAAFKEVRGYN